MGEICRVLVYEDIFLKYHGGDLGYYTLFCQICRKPVFHSSAEKAFHMFGVRILGPFFQAEFRSAAAYFQPHHAEEEWSHASADITLDFYFFDTEGGRRGWPDTVQHI